MSDMKHTPGPWAVNDYGPKSGNVIRFEIDAPGSIRICDIEDPEIGGDEDVMTPATAEANSRLIASAPDLLKACKEWVSYFDRLARDDEPGDKLAEARNAFHRNRVEATRAAIEKAQGGAS